MFVKRKLDFGYNLRRIDNDERKAGNVIHRPRMRRVTRNAQPVDRIDNILRPTLYVALYTVYHSRRALHVARCALHVTQRYPHLDTLPECYKIKTHFSPLSCGRVDVSTESELKNIISLFFLNIFLFRKRVFYSDL